MKKTLIMIFILLITMSLTMSLSASISGVDGEYKVVKKGKKSGEPTMFRMLITENGKNKVKVTLPLMLVDTILENSDYLSIDCCKNRNDIDFKKIYKKLKKCGVMTIVEVEDGDEKIKIWFE